MKPKFMASVSLLIILVMVLSACAAPTPAPTTAPQEPAAPAEPAKTEEPAPAEETGGFQIPEIQEGKFNVAMVLIGPHDDGGWSQAHYEGLEYVEKNVPNVHTAYIENVPEGADSEQVFRSLARKGFNMILGTSFGFMDPMETVAEEFPDSYFIHISGFKSNSTNFGNLFGAMENMNTWPACWPARAPRPTGTRSWATWPPSRSRRNCAWATPSRWA
jgi:basic membrane protein A